MAQFLRPDGTISASSITGTYTAIDEATASDADFVYSANNADTTYEVSVSNPSGTPASGNVTIRYRIARTNAGTVDGAGSVSSVVASLVEGTTVLGSDSSRTATGTWTQYSFTVATSAVTDWTNLRIRFVITGGGGNPSNRRGVGISWAEVETPDAPVTNSGSFTADAYIERAGIAGSFVADAYIKKTIYVPAGSENSVDAEWTWDASLDGWTQLFPLVEQTGGKLRLSTSAFESGNAAQAEWQGTWEDLGVPVGETVTGVQVINLDRIISGNGDFSAAWSGGQVTVNGSQVLAAISGNGSDSASGSRLNLSADSFDQVTLQISVFCSASQGDSASVQGDFDNLVLRVYYGSGGPGTTFTLDAEISAAAGDTVTGSFTADAYVSATVGGSLTANAHISKSDIASSFTADAFVKRVDLSGSLTADAFIKRTFEATFTADSYVKRVDLSGSFTADAYVRKLDIAGSFTANAHISKTVSGSFTADAVITNSGVGSFTADAHISRLAIEQSFTADAYIKRLGLTGSFTADAFISKGSTGSFTADAFVRQTFEQTFTADAYVQLVQSGSFTADAYLRRTLSATFTADAFVQVTTGGIFVADAYILRTFGDNFTANAYVSQLVTGSFTANAEIAPPEPGERLGSFTADAFIRRVGLNGSFTADAYILRSSAGSFVADAFIGRTFEQSFLADAFIRVERTGSLTADAFVFRTFTDLFTTDAHISATVMSSFTLDAHIHNPNAVRNVTGSTSATSIATAGVTTTTSFMQSPAGAKVSRGRVSRGISGTTSVSTGE
jgi:hypothetical protein